jgi:putative flippase GtrA
MLMMHTARRAASLRRGLSVRRLGQYGIVGVSGLALVTLLFWLLHDQAGLHYLAAGIVANEAAVCSNYLLNNNWTFSDRRARFICLAGLARYHAVSFSGILLHAGALLVIAGLLSVRPLIANLIAVALAAAWSLLWNMLWTWRLPRRPAGGHTQGGSQTRLYIPVPAREGSRGGRSL